MADQPSISSSSSFPRAATPAGSRSPLRRPVYPHLSALLLDSPLAILPEKLETILQALGPRLIGGQFDQEAMEWLVESGVLRSKADREHLAELLAFDEWDDGPTGQRDDEKAYKTTDAGVAIIPVTGVLMKKGTWMTALSGCTSYTQIRSTFDAAMDDNQVRAIVLDVDSPGGTTHGCFELSDHIHKARGDKPIWGIANDLAASAAYALASAADKLYLTRTAGVGSIGVFAMHADTSGADEQAGVKYTYVFAGEHKVDGNPHEPMSKNAKDTTQAEVDREYRIFVDTVARNRKQSAKSIVDTKADVLFADLAIPLLADSVGSIQDAVKALTAQINPGYATLSRRNGNRAAASPGQPATVVKTEGAEEMATSLAELKKRRAALDTQFAELEAEATAFLADPEAAVVPEVAASKKEPEAKEKPPGKEAAGTKACPACDGSGEDEDGEPCKSCDGTGKVESKKAKKATAKPKEPKDDGGGDDDEEGKKAALLTNANVRLTAVNIDRPNAATIDQIETLCAIAGRGLDPEMSARFNAMAADFILAESSITEVRAKLQERRSTMSSTYPVSAFQTGARTDPFDTITRQAQAMHQASGGSVKLSECLRRVAAANPMLVEAYDEQRQEATKSPSRVRDYIATMTPRMRGLGLSSNIDSISGGIRGL